jgi:hypothetical protein
MITAISLLAQAFPNRAKSSTMIVKDLPGGKDPGIIRPQFVVLSLSRPTLPPDFQFAQVSGQPLPR